MFNPDGLSNIAQAGIFERSFIWQPSIGIFEYSLPMGAGEYEFQLNPSTDFATACVDSGSYVHHDR